MTERQRGRGVDLESAEAAKERIGQDWSREPGPRCLLGHVGAFGGMVRVPPGM
jgi:hypothetical protein